MYKCLLERTGLPLQQKINLSMPDTTNSIIEQQEVVNPCHEYYKGRCPTANNPTPRVTRLVLRDLNLLLALDLTVNIVTSRQQNLLYT